MQQVYETTSIIRLIRDSSYQEDERIYWYQVDERLQVPGGRDTRRRGGLNGSLTVI
jgi:hypothetical protein